LFSGEWDAALKGRSSTVGAFTVWRFPADALAVDLLAALLQKTSQPLLQVTVDVHGGASRPIMHTRLFGTFRHFGAKIKWEIRE